MVRNARRRPSVVWLGVCLLLALGRSPRAAAQEQTNDSNDSQQYFHMSMEELMDVPYDVVEGPSKYMQAIGKAPAAVTVVTADEIRLYGYRTLADILDSVTGFYTTYDRNYHYIGVRGFRRPGDYDTRILVLVNGFRVNENIADVPGVSLDAVADVDLIERVEVIRGPGSSLYGSNALLAVVNIVTKSGRTLQGVETLGELSDYNAARGRLSYGRTFGEDRSVLVSASGYRTDGPELYFREFDTPETSGRVENDDARFHNAFAQAAVGPLSLTVAHTDYDKDIPTAPWGTVFGDTRTRSEDSRTLVGVSCQQPITETTLLKGHLAYHEYIYGGWFPMDYAEEGDPPDVVVNRDLWEGRWCEAEAQVVTTAVPRHTLTAGLQGQYNFNQDQRNWDIDVYLNDHEHDSRHWGAYAQDEFALTDRWTLIGGVRYDSYPGFGGTTNPRLGVIGRVFEQTVLKLLYGKAFRAPNAYELFYDDGGNSMKANPDLEPERIETYELVIEQTLRQNLTARLSLFSFTLDDIIEQAPDPADDLLVFGNQGAIEAQGLEVSLDGRWTNGLRLRTGYSFVEATDERTDRTVVDSPQHLAKINVIAPLIRDRLFAGLGVRYTSRARTLDGDWADDFWVTDLWLTYENLAPGLELAVGVENLFDVHYAYPGSGDHVQDLLRQDGRLITARLIYRFK